MSLSGRWRIEHVPNCIDFTLKYPFLLHEKLHLTEKYVLRGCPNSIIEIVSIKVRNRIYSLIGGIHKNYKN